MTNYILERVLNFSTKLSMVVHTWSLSTWEAEAKGYQGIQASLGYIHRTYLTFKTNKQTNNKVKKTEPSGSWV